MKNKFQIISYSGGSAIDMRGGKMFIKVPSSATWTPFLLTDGELGPFYDFCIIDVDEYSSYICQATIDGTPANIYDFQPSTNNYKIASDGEWVDGSGETLLMTKWKDQSGLGFDWTFATPYPEILLNEDTNGSPMLEFPVGSACTGTGSETLSGETDFSIATRQILDEAGAGVTYMEDGDTVAVQPYFEEVQ